MALSPQEIRDAAFKTVKRGGLDPDEVTAFKLTAADSLQQALQNATAMEARARAAVARLQELTQQQAEAPAASPAPVAAATAPEPVAEAPAAPREPTPDESETISRTLLLAQRSADQAIADAQREAVDIIDAAKAESRRAGEAERVRVEGEVQALLARRDFLESDVDQLEQHLAAQRERITEVVAELEAVTNRVPNGLAAMRRPQLSASDQTATAAESVAARFGEPFAAEQDDAEQDDVDVAELIDEVVDPDASAEIARIGGVQADAESAPVTTQQPAVRSDAPPDDRHTLFGPES